MTVRSCAAQQVDGNAARVSKETSPALPPRPLQGEKDGGPKGGQHIKVTIAP